MRKSEEPWFDINTTDPKVPQKCKPKNAWYDLSGEVNDLDSIEHLLSRSESEKRLNLLCTITSIGLLICATAFVLICFRIYAPPTIVYYENKISIKTQSSQPNIAILSPDGNLTSYSWKTSKESSLPKLPKAFSYGMACFDQKLYTFGMSTYTGMTIIQPNGTHRLVKTRGLNPFTTESKILKIRAGHLVAFDHYLWSVGLSKLGTGKVWDFIPETFLYSFSKNQWIEGPSIPHGISTVFGCAVSLNRSFSLLIGGHFQEFIDTTINDAKINDLVLGYDFNAQNWIWKPIPYFDNPFTLLQKYFITCAMKHGKSGNFINVLITETNYKDKGGAALLEFNAQANIWSQKFTLQNIEQKGKLVALHGILHYFPFSSYSAKTIGYCFDCENNTIHPVGNPTDTSISSINAVNCYTST